MANSFQLPIGHEFVAISNTRYRNIQYINKGGNAIAYLVLALSGPNRGCLFVLKVFVRISDEGRRKKFLEEVSFLETCAHPSIMRTFDSGEYINADDANVYPFVVVEYLPATLSLVELKELSILAKLSCTLQLLSGLIYLQELDPPVIHRDIKPQNIFIKGRSYVLGDFGLMKRYQDENDEGDKEIFKHSSGPGMPYRYRTPDLVSYAKNESNISPKSDIYQLGLVIALIFTGKNPCKQCNDILDPVELNEIPEIRGALGGSISKLIKKMLEENPNNRPFANALLGPWEINFSRAVDASHILQGEVFAPSYHR